MSLVSLPTGSAKGIAFSCLQFVKRFPELPLHESEVSGDVLQTFSFLAGSSEVHYKPTKWERLTFLRLNTGGPKPTE
jgi:hypothetical protein